MPPKKQTTACGRGRPRKKKTEVRDAAADDEDDERRKSGLKFKDPDLKVIVGVDEDEDGNKKEGSVTEKRKVFWYFSEVLGSKSKYIETLLSNPLALASSKSSSTSDLNKKRKRTNTGEEKEEGSNDIGDGCGDDSETEEVKTITFPELLPKFV